jgi:hypothetical protein
MKNEKKKNSEHATQLFSRKHRERRKKAILEILDLGL